MLSCLGSSLRPRLRLREREGADEAAEDLVREVRVEGDEYRLVRKADVRGQSFSKLGKRGVRIEEVGLSFVVEAARGGP